MLGTVLLEGNIVLTTVLTSQTSTGQIGELGLPLPSFVICNRGFFSRAKIEGEEIEKMKPRCIPVSFTCNIFQIRIFNFFGIDDNKIQAGMYNHANIPFISHFYGHGSTWYGGQYDGLPHRTHHQPWLGGLESSIKQEPGRHQDRGDEIATDFGKTQLDHRQFTHHCHIVQVR